MMEQFFDLDLLPPVPGPHPHRFLCAVGLLIVLLIQLICLACLERQERQVRWRRGVRPRRRYNTRQ
jgi:hypothetical protein